MTRAVGRWALGLSLLAGSVPLSAKLPAETGATPPGETASAPIELAEPKTEQRAYALYVPKKLAADPNRPAPVMVVLHGSGQSAEQMVETWQGLADREGLIVIGPSAQNSKQWSLQSDGPHLISTLIGAIEEEHAIDRRRIYLFGYSGGGLYALTLGLIESEYFAGVASYAAIWKKDEDGAALKFMKRRLPVKLLIGTGDAIYDRDQQNQMRQTLRNGRALVDVTLVDGQGHRYDNVSREVNELVWGFLKDKKLSAEPIYVDYGLDKAADTP